MSGSMLRRPALAVVTCLIGGMTSAIAIAAAPPAASTSVQRIVVIRHGEKPTAGLGQLSCRGLARAIALPDVLLAKFGTPQHLFAPNPAVRKPDRGMLYSYIRPLATIEPLAVRVGLPVDVQHGFHDTAAVVRTLDQPQYAGTFSVIAWEHKVVKDMVREILRRNGGDPKTVHSWKDDDFDRVDVITITRSPGQPSHATYALDAQNLNSNSDECPRAPAR